jgi:hypothetical protein
MVWKKLGFFVYNSFMAKNFTPIDDLIKNSRPSVSTPMKEVEPPVYSQEKYDIKETAEQEVDKEVRPFIEVKSQTIQLPPDLKRLGVQPVSPTVFQSFQNIKLPISDDKVVVGLHAPISSSFRWLATLALYILRRAHLSLKTVHGKVIRILMG